MENLVDQELQDVLGDRYVEDKPVAIAAQHKTAENSSVVESSLTRIVEAIKRPALFAALCMFIGWTAHMELMDAIVAVPGMCVCSAFFGWHVHK